MEVEELRYAFYSNTTCQVAGLCDPDAVSVVIPAMHGKRPVTEIGLRAFSGCTSLESVTIPASVKYIGELAFLGCTSLSGLFISGEAGRKIIIRDAADSSTSVTAYRYSEEKPSVEGNFWHYVNGEPVVWQNREQS